MPIFDYALILHGSWPNGSPICYSGDQTTDSALDLSTMQYIKSIASTGRFGMHVFVTQGFNNLTSIGCRICNENSIHIGAILMERSFHISVLKSGMHAYIPLPAGCVLTKRYLYGVVGVSGSNPTQGRVIIWFAPPDGTETI